MNKYPDIGVQEKTRAGLALRNYARKSYIHFFTQFPHRTTVDQGPMFPLHAFSGAGALWPLVCN
jgi:hypothetical protein